MQLTLVGTSHHQAPVEVRERLVVGAEFVDELGSADEAVCLSTCNRTELYLAAPEGATAELAGAQALSRLGGVEIEPLLYRLHNEAAALHLFRVAAGLDSLVPGEGEILGQVRASYESGRVGPLLDRLFRQAVHIGKRVRAETAIGESPTSVPAAAAALAQQVFGDLTGRRVLVIGAGKTGEQAARSLLARGAEIAAVANRDPARAAELARRVGGRPVTLDSLGEELAGVDVVVSATSSAGVVLRREQVAGAVAARRGVPLFLIDIAVPRDLDPEIDELEDCYLYDIDDLQEVVDASLAGRRREGEAAETMVAQEATGIRLLARLPRRGARDHPAPRARGGDSPHRARACAGKARPAERRRPKRRGVTHVPDREQAPPSADRADEGGCGRCRRSRIRRHGPQALRPR